MSEKIKLKKISGKNKLNLFCNNMDFPLDCLGKDAHITLFGDREAVIDGCYGIITYSTEFVKINIGNKQLCFTGFDFDISEYSDLLLRLKGSIKNIEFC